jgi:hypothetical protein
MKAMHKLRTELWDDSEKNTLRIGVIKYVGPCDYKPEMCTKPARIQIEVRNGLGNPIWHRDYCHEHAAPVLDKAKAIGFRIIED